MSIEKKSYRDQSTNGDGCDRFSLRLPPRIQERSRPELWSQDEILTLIEAAALWWPHGPLTVKSLRHAIAAGQLPFLRLAGKLFVTPRAIREMTTCTRTPTPRSD
ncbi:hypothetical protein ACQKLX_21165 [Bosea sp. NPDC003192]|uniref:hypothetical protein n=1 Tax=Bosea sp. NPDC003192 TaxID=3390551 RepID=UPI003D001B6A